MASYLDTWRKNKTKHLISDRWRLATFFCVYLKNSPQLFTERSVFFCNCQSSLRRNSSLCHMIFFKVKQNLGTEQKLVLNPNMKMNRLTRIPAASELPVQNGCSDWWMPEIEVEVPPFQAWNAWRNSSLPVLGLCGHILPKAPSDDKVSLTAGSGWSPMTAGWKDRQDYASMISHIVPPPGSFPASFLSPQNPSRLHFSFKEPWLWCVALPS